MQSDALLHYLQNDLKIRDYRVVNGQHSQKTSEAWFVRWRVFFITCAELRGLPRQNGWFRIADILILGCGYTGQRLAQRFLAKAPA
jgi:hypothetical protein